MRGHELALSSKRGHSSEAEICDLDTIVDAIAQVKQLVEARVPAAGHPLNRNVTSKSMRKELVLREAVLLTFCDPTPEESSRLFCLTAKEWESLLRWLDLSGLALYFLNRLIELDLCDLLPSAVITRLHLNQIDNSQRTQGMLGESVGIQEEFQKADLSYAVLKGLSLWPLSVPSLELRSQFDLDFLVAEDSAPEARRILERRGYRLYAISGRSWEFKRNERPGLSLKHLYKNLPSFAVELHIEPGVKGVISALDRRECRELRGMKMPVLSPVDLMLGQGLHAFKHTCSEFARAAHFLEFRRHVLSRRDDNVFWNDLKCLAENSSKAATGLGVVTLLITRVMGEFAPEALTSWTVDHLSRPVRLWVETYAPRVILGSHPGSKLYLLLQNELELAGMREKRPIRRALLPLCLPPSVIRAFPHEGWSVRARRYRMQFELLVARLGFHLVEGVRFAVESRRWKRVKELAR